MSHGAVSPRLCFDAAALGRVRVVLCQTSHPGNIGSAARAMKTMGLSQLVLVRPRNAPDAQSIALASGAVDVLQAALIVDSLAEALAGTALAVAMTSRRRELAAEPLWLRDAAGLLAARLADADDGRDVALVFGNETFGLSNDELACCGRWAMIPANPDYASLNVAAAVQLAAYEVRQAMVHAGPPPAIPDAGLPASHDEIEGLLGHIESAAIDAGFLDPASPKRLMARLRRLFARAAIEREEVNILRGLVAAMQRRQAPGANTIVVDKKTRDF